MVKSIGKLAVKTIIDFLTSDPVGFLLKLLTGVAGSGLWALARRSRKMMATNQNSRWSVSGTQYASHLAPLGVVG
jgi:hypothetical protein